MPPDTIIEIDEDGKVHPPGAGIDGKMSAPPADGALRELLGRVLLEVADERHRQDAKWGEQNHDDGRWSLILAEEVGEAAHDALHNAASLRKELLETAAVAVAWIGAIDRRALAAPREGE